MGRKELPANTPGTPTIAAMPDGRFKVKARMRLIDYTRRDPETGTYLPGARVDLYAIVGDRQLADAAIRSAANERIIRAKADAKVAADSTLSASWTVSQSVGEALEALALSDDVAPTSLYVYRTHTAGHVDGSPLGGMPIGTVKPADVSAHLTALATQSGMATAKHGRAVLNHGFGLAVKLGVLDRNPVREIGQLRATKAAKAKVAAHHLDHQRALSKAERVDLAWRVARDQRAIDLDLRDLVLAGLAIGARVGELAAVRWCDVTFTEAGARVRLGGTITRASGAQLARTDPKTVGSDRTIPVGRRVAALLRRRALVAGVGHFRGSAIDQQNLTTDTRPVFPAPGRWALPGESESWRDISNTTKRLRELFDRCGYGWVSFHTLRRSAVTALADVLPIRTASAFAGHASVRTTIDFYLGKDAKLDDSLADHL
ncbi:MAG: tyrosine-type recombinase/integrase [Actinomycetota bacterium]|nr:tyrosine-type recombinase/integrase [Actinomycetota bacterium]